MGVAQSNSVSITDVANQFVTDVTTNVISKNQTSGSGTQSLKVKCTDAAFNAATEACSRDTQNQQILAATLAKDPETLPFAQLLLSKSPDSCSMCAAENISMDMNVSIKTDAINNNKIASEIKDALTAKLDQATKSETSAGLSSYSSSDSKALTRIRNYVQNNFDTKIVNETLNTFTFTQSIDSENMKLSNINMKLVGSAVASTLVDNMIKADKTLLTDLTSTNKAETKTEGTKLPSLMDLLGFGGLGMYGLIAVVCIVFAIMVASFMGGGSQSQPMGYDAQFDQQGMYPPDGQFDQQGMYPPDAQYQQQGMYPPDAQYQQQGMYPQYQQQGMYPQM
jgi:hypothetical protein